MKKLLIFLLLISQISFAQDQGIIASGMQGVTAFSPTALTPIAWWDSRSADMASDGSLWTDRIGTYAPPLSSYNLSASGTERPTYSSTALNGLPGFVYDGSDDVQAGSVISQIQNTAHVSIWMVGKRCSFSQDDGTSTNATNLVHYFADDNVYMVFCVGGFNYGVTTSSITNAFHYFLMVYDGTQGTDAGKLKIYVDGVQKTLTFVVAIPTLTENSGSSAPHAGYYRGNYQAGTTCEMGVVNRTLSGTEITNLNSYLATKYAL